MDADAATVHKDDGSTPQGTQGRLVRFVGRNRIHDSKLKSLELCALGLLCFPLCIKCCKSRRARKSWKEVFFQTFSIGRLPSPIPNWSSTKLPGSVRFVFISDTHMKHRNLPVLPEGDVLVHCGDFTNYGLMEEVQEFVQWFGEQKHPTKLVVPGNHDMILDGEFYDQYWSDWSKIHHDHTLATKLFDEHQIQLLCDKTVEVDGLRVHGSPWTTQRNPWRTAFQKPDAEMSNVWLQLPKVDVLLTHMPPFGILDREDNGAHEGCPHLARRVSELAPKLHLFGHIHPDYGIFQETIGTTVYANGSSVSDFYHVGKRIPLVFDVVVGGE